MLAAGAAAADLFQQYGLDRQAWADSFVNSLTDRALYVPSLSAKLKSVPEGQRAAVVNALGTVANAFVGTSEFTARYGKEYEVSLPDDLRPPRSAAEIEKSMRAEMQKGLTEMEAAVKDFQGDARKHAEAAMAQMRGELKAQLATVGPAAEEVARYEKARSRPPDPDALPPDPRVSPRKALKPFFDETFRRRLRRADEAGVANAPLREGRLREEAECVVDVPPRRGRGLQRRARVCVGRAGGAEAGSFGPTGVGFRSYRW